MEKKKIIRITPRGLATVLAVQEGVIPKVEGGYDNEAFNRFWDRYEAESKSLQKKADDVLCDELQKSQKIGFAAFGFSFGILIGLLLSSF